MANAQPLTIEAQLRLHDETWAIFKRIFRNAAYYADLDERRALAAFIADGGDPYEVRRIEEALGVTE